jgi:hypothetical protein
VKFPAFGGQRFWVQQMRPISDRGVGASSPITFRFLVWAIFGSKVNGMPGCWSRGAGLDRGVKSDRTEIMKAREIEGKHS